MLDLIVKDGIIVDGTGKPGFRGDVGISGARIVEVGKVSARATRTLPAEGRLITPGFVDIHTHFDGQASWDPVLAPSSSHGVTSIAMGNCGVGFAPAKPDKHDWLIALLEGVEDIPGTSLAEGLTWDWQSFPEYLDALERRTFTMDVGAHLPHAALRTYVMGERGGDHSVHPTDEEVTEMERLTSEALEAGALGFSTSRTIAHQSRNGSNIGTLRATDHELSGAARALGRAGRGVIQLISDAYLTADESFAEAELALIHRLAKISGRKVSFTVQQTDNVPNRWRALMAAAHNISASGMCVRAQVAPRPVGVILSFASSANPFAATATHQRLRAKPFAERLAALRLPEIKTRILAEHRTGKVTGMGALVTSSFSRMFRMASPVDYEPDAGSSLQAEAIRNNRDVAEYAYDVFLEEGGRQVIYLPIFNYARGALGEVFEMMSDTHALYGLSDAGAHCGAISDGSFPTTALALWGRGNKAGQKVPVETLINGYTQRNASHVGWLDRGVVGPGYLADLNVIDLDNLSVSAPQLVADLPAGGARYLQSASGYRWTIKRGHVTFDDGVHSGELPGRLQRGSQPAP
jgi:N-acyl-D-aspartate/D-glutamate deacylase